VVISGGADRLQDSDRPVPHIAVILGFGGGLEPLAWSGDLGVDC
jgi:hypothetical protein